jgi:FAD/FMN-containing dehydrogenase
MTTLVSKITDNQPAGQDFGYVQQSAQRATRSDLIGSGYLGYPFTNADDASHLFYGDNYPRLQQLKRQYDANNVFASPLNVVA